MGMKFGIIVFVAAVLPLAGCENAYYGVMERFNVEKRDILIDRVQNARDSQAEAKEQFRHALDVFESVVDFEGGELEDMYREMKTEYELSEDAADRVSERIDMIENVAEDLFDEWEEELDDYTSEELRLASSRKLAQTQFQYAELLNSMRQVEVKMIAVLEAFEDQVLFLKHNLNAVAVASLKDEFVTIRSAVETLVDDMEESIARAEAFIDEMMKP